MCLTVVCMESGLFQIQSHFKVCFEAKKLFAIFMSIPTSVLNDVYIYVCVCVCVCIIS